MPYFKLIFLSVTLLVLTGCSLEENIVSSEDNSILFERSPILLEGGIELIPLTAEEMGQLIKDKGVSIEGGIISNEKRQLPCRWSDDRDGATYGMLDCPDGKCGGGTIVTGDGGSGTTYEPVLTCTNPDGSIELGGSRGVITVP